MPAVDDEIVIIEEESDDDKVSRKDYVLNEIETIRDILYQSYNTIQSASALLESINPSNPQASGSYAIVLQSREIYTSSLHALTHLTDEINKYEPYAGFPQAGERIIRVGDTFDIIWNSQKVPSINIYFMKGGTKIPVTILKEDIKNKKSFVIDVTHYSEEYLPCKVRVESSNVNTIFDESPVFKVLKSN